MRVVELPTLDAVALTDPQKYSPCRPSKNSPSEPNRRTKWRQEAGSMSRYARQRCACGGSNASHPIGKGLQSSQEYS